MNGVAASQLASKQLTIAQLMNRARDVTTELIAKASLRTSGTLPLLRSWVMGAIMQNRIFSAASALKKLHLHSILLHGHSRVLIP